MKAKQSVPNTPKLPEDVGKRFDKRFYNGMKFHKSLAFNEMALEKTMRDEIRQFLAQELSTLKAQVRKEIEELEYNHEYCVSCHYTQAIADCLSIPSLEEE